jgi:hypothetical protein
MLFYGYLPDFARYAFRKVIHGPDIMKLGIDFHQFRYGLLNKAFRKTGFSKIYDIVDVADPRPGQSGTKVKLMQLSKKYWIFRKLFLFFFPTTTFVVVK